jgi:hypothetical protein
MENIIFVGAVKSDAVIEYPLLRDVRQWVRSN